MAKKDGGPVFPNKGTDPYYAGDDHSYDGISTRVWIATHALAGALAGGAGADGEAIEISVQMAYKYADAMLEAGRKEGE